MTLFGSTTACDLGHLGGDGANGSPKDDVDPTAPAAYADSVDALFDVLVPTERDASGKVTSVGARDSKPESVMSIDRFAALAVTLGFLPPLGDAALTNLGKLDGAARLALNADLDLLATVESPGAAFRDLSAAQRESVVEAALADDAHAPGILVLRAVAFFAYLGAVGSDVGLRAIGFPKFENFADGLACSGYPKNGEDYTFNEEPPATTGDDLTGVLDDAGDLV